MEKLSNNAQRLARNLFADAAEGERFSHALATPQPYAPAIVWLGEPPESRPFAIETPFDWQPEFVDRVAENQRPGQHPLHTAGRYYCLDNSSVFCGGVLAAAEREPMLAIDVCAAPGGKSVLAWRQVRPRLLLCNEVIKKRTAPLIANLQRCGIRPAAVTTLDSARLAVTCPESAELVVVDAPCSGQSLMVRGKDSPGCFHPATINLNANRQRRILANAASLVAPRGMLAYMTCTYSAKENEETVRWLMKRRPHFVPVAVTSLAAFQSHLADFACYRLWPQQGQGAGGFTVLLRNEADGERREVAWDRLPMVWRC